MLLNYFREVCGLIINTRNEFSKNEFHLQNEFTKEQDTEATVRMGSSKDSIADSLV